MGVRQLDRDITYFARRSGGPRRSCLVRQGNCVLSYVLRVVRYFCDATPTKVLCGSYEIVA